MRITPLEEWIAAQIPESSAGLTRERIEDYQLEKLKETIDWAGTESPFYRERLAGFAGRDIACPKDVAKLPFTTAEDLRKNPHRFLCVSQSEVTRVVTLQTSGTTGNPKRIFFTSEDQERTIDFFHHGMSTLAGPGKRVLILFPGESPGSVGDLLLRGLERLGAVGIPHGPVGDALHVLNLIEKEGIDVLVGIPTQAFELARLSGGKAGPGKVLLSADHVPEAIARELHRAWGCEVFTHYGMAEMGFGGGVECEARKGYHLREADLYFEIVDTRTGGAVAEGEAGEVVFTTLTRRAMPLIRYRTGDLSRFLRESCPCGTVLKTLARVTSSMRSTRLLASGDSLSMAQLDEAIFPVEGVLDFAAFLWREQGMDWLRIDVRAGEALGSEAADAIRENLGKVPELRSAVTAGMLLLSVVLVSEGRHFGRGTAKRVIQG
jgi:phenylacetate-coenzyme A ligase PaaK-like adenylate-forming protein